LHPNLKVEFVTRAFHLHFKGDNESVFSQSSEAVQQHQGKHPSQHGKRGSNIKQRFGELFSNKILF
jgi:hypothetical protein